MTNPAQSESVRQRLAAIDGRLLAALRERIALQQSCSDFPAIWEQSLNQVAAQVPELPSDGVLNWLMHTASLCARQSTKREPIVFLGPLYSYSYLAAVKHFGLAADFVPVVTIAAAFEEIARSQAAFAVVPIENNTDGGVVDTLGRFARSPAQICGEVLLPIHHCLLGRCTRAEIREVHSKPQALSQCRNWLAEHLPDVKLVEVASTSAAAVRAAETPGIAAIASSEAGIHHGCNIIDENIEDNQHNVTRFAIIGNRRCQPTGTDKTSLMFQLKHEPGALANAILTFKEYKVNLTWIESFPLPDRPNEYLFFIELDGHAASPPVAAIINELQAKTQQIDVLGSYPRG